MPKQEMLGFTIFSRSFIEIFQKKSETIEIRLNRKILEICPEMKILEWTEYLHVRTKYFIIPVITRQLFSLSVPLVYCPNTISRK